MTGPDPLDVSPYLTLPRRDLRTACKAAMRHANRRTPCGACPIADICAKTDAPVDQVSRRNSPDTLPRAALKASRETEAVCIAV